MVIYYYLLRRFIDLAPTTYMSDCAFTIVRARIDCNSTLNHSQRDRHFHDSSPDNSRIIILSSKPIFYFNRL